MNAYTESMSTVWVDCGCVGSFLLGMIFSMQKMYQSPLTPLASFRVLEDLDILLQFLINTWALHLHRCVTRRGSFDMNYGKAIFTPNFFGARTADGFQCSGIFLKVKKDFQDARNIKSDLSIGQFFFEVDSPVSLTAYERLCAEDSMISWGSLMLYFRCCIYWSLLSRARN